jgi:hypothetical protein
LRDDINSEFRKCDETDFSNKGHTVNQSELTIPDETDFNRDRQKISQ